MLIASRLKPTNTSVTNTALDFSSQSDSIVIVAAGMHSIHCTLGCAQFTEFDTAPSPLAKLPAIPWFDLSAVFRWIWLTLFDIPFFQHRQNWLLVLWNIRWIAENQHVVLLFCIFVSMGTFRFEPWINNLKQNLYKNWKKGILSQDHLDIHVVVSF